MLLFIAWCKHQRGWSGRISIHLMLLFIGESRSWYGDGWKISIHLMLLFIKSVINGICHTLIISIHLMLLFISASSNVDLINADFNTSHVTVYPNGAFDEMNLYEFQYISCYCLSLWRSNPHIRWKISIHLMLLFIIHTGCQKCCWQEFQYISCYCLSEYLPDCMMWYGHFNTSHVTVYLDFTAGYLIGQYFNTSHVTVYREGGFYEAETKLISIHLMLLFIQTLLRILLLYLLISIHLMLLFIECLDC